MTHGAVSPIGSSCGDHDNVRGQRSRELQDLRRWVTMPHRGSNELTTGSAFVKPGAQLQQQGLTADGTQPDGSVQPLFFLCHMKDSQLGMSDASNGTRVQQCSFGDS